MKKMKKVVYWIVIVFVLMYVQLVVKEFFRQSGSDAPNNTAVAPTETTTGSLTEKDREEYMSGCLNQNNEEYCKCTFDKSAEVYTKQDLINANNEVRAGRDLPKVMLDIIAECKALTGRR